MATTRCARAFLGRAVRGGTLTVAGRVKRALSTLGALRSATRWLRPSRRSGATARPSCPAARPAPGPRGIEARCLVTSGPRAAAQAPSPGQRASRLERSLSARREGRVGPTRCWCCRPSSPKRSRIAAALVSRAPCGCGRDRSRSCAPSTNLDFHLPVDAALDDDRMLAAHALDFVTEGHAVIFEEQAGTRQDAPGHRHRLPRPAERLRRALHDRRGAHRRAVGCRTRRQDARGARSLRPAARARRRRSRLPSKLRRRRYARWATSSTMSSTTATSAGAR